MVYSVRFTFDVVEDGVTLNCFPTEDSAYEQRLNVGELWCANFETLRSLVIEAELPLKILEANGIENVYSVTGDQLVMLGYPLEPDTR